MNCISEILQTDWDRVTAIANVILAATAVVSAIYASTQLRDFRRDGRIKRLIDLVAQFEQDPLARLRKDLAVERLDETHELRPLDVTDPPYSLHDIMNFFEHMGYLLDRDYLDLEGVAIEFHYWIFHIFGDARLVIQHEQREVPIYYEYFVKMENRLEGFERKAGRDFRVSSTEEIRDFYLEEARLVPGSPIPRQSRKRRR